MFDTSRILTPIFSLTLFSIAFGAPDQDLEHLRATIKKADAHWKAGPTAVSKRSWDEKKRLCGLLFAERPGMSPIDSTAITSSSDPALTPTLDWRLQDKVTAVKKQGGCGGSWAFAAVGALESAMLIADQSLAPGSIDLSEQMMVSCDQGNFGCCGGYMKDAYEFLLTTGTVDEDCLAYEPSGSCRCSPRWCMSKTTDCARKCGDWAQRVRKLSAWQWVNATAVVPTVDELKAAVAQGPVPVGMDVYDDLFSYTGGVYEHVGGEYAGSHAVIIVGWEDPDARYPDGRWIVKNSWGSSWGEEGFFRIKWGDARIGMDAAVLSYAATVCPDRDGDGHTDMACGGTDCNDDDPAVSPDAVEVCDALDNNCDGRVDEGFVHTTYYLDSDADGYGDLATGTQTCGEAPPDYVANGGDCNDDDPSVKPGAAEVCDGIDNNCDGTIDEGFSTTTYYRDADGDDYGDPEVRQVVCDGQSTLTGYVTHGDDCDDANGAINPGAREVCDDGIDNDCDGMVDEGCTASCRETGEPCRSDEECCSGGCLPDATCR